MATALRCLTTVVAIVVLALFFTPSLLRCASAIQRRRPNFA